MKCKIFFITFIALALATIISQFILPQDYQDYIKKRIHEKVDTSLYVKDFLYVKETDKYFIKCEFRSESRLFEVSRDDWEKIKKINSAYDIYGVTSFVIIILLIIFLAIKGGKIFMRLWTKRWEIMIRKADRP